MTEILATAWHVLGQMAPFLLLGFFVAGLLHAYVPQRWLVRAMGGRGFGPIVRGTLIGMPLPLCSCGVVPVAVELREKGASRGAVTAFLVTTPETGVDSIAASFAVLHPWMALARPLAAIVTGLVAGVSVERFSKAPARPVVITETPDCCRHDAPVVERRGLLAGLRHAFVDLFAEVGVWLLPAILISAVLTAVLEPGAVAKLVSSHALQMAILLVVGIPVYVCATAATPLAGALIASGFSPGSALVFLLVGPATNVVTIVAAKKMLGTKGAVLYVAAVAVTSVLAGIALDALFAHFGVAPGQVASHDHAHESWLTTASSIVLLALIARVWWQKLLRR